MSKTIFIADLHLDKRYPDAVSAFLYYLKTLEKQSLEKQSIDALYILGDLFEYWLGDDCVDKTAKQVADGLYALVEKTQLPVFFIHGNRDFLLGERYATDCGMRILPEQTEINLYGIKTLVLHGDTLCTDDIDYQRFRAKVRNPRWQKDILKLPAWIRRLKALQMRYQSKKANAGKSLTIMDVSPSTVETMMRNNDVTQIIHGHTHRPAIHDFVLDGKAAKRCVVGDWYTQGSVLEIAENHCELITIPLTN